MAEGHAAIKERKKWSAVWLLGAARRGSQNTRLLKLVQKNYLTSDSKSADFVGEEIKWCVSTE